MNVPKAITGISGADAEGFSAMLNIIYDYKLPDIPTSTYVSVGAGYINAGRDDFTITTSSDSYTFNQASESSLGVNGAVGLRHAVGQNLSLYLEAKFVTALFVDNWTQYVPISVGISF